MFRVATFTLLLLAFGPEARAEFQVSPGFTVKARQTYGEAKAQACYERRPLAVWVGMEPIPAEAPANAIHVRVESWADTEAPALVVGEPWPGKDDLFIAAIRLFRAGRMRTSYAAPAAPLRAPLLRTLIRTVPVFAAPRRAAGGC